MFNPRFIRSQYTFVFLSVGDVVRKFQLYSYDEEFFNSQEGCWDTKPRRSLIKLDNRFVEVDRTTVRYDIPNTRYKFTWLYKVI